MANIFQSLQYKIFNMAMKAQTGTRGTAFNFLNTKPSWNDWSGEVATREGYKAATFVYSCINKKARAAASVPWYVYKPDSAGKWEEVKNHPLEQLIKSPNPFMSRSDLIERMVINLDLAGNSLFKKVNVGRTPVELWPLETDTVKPVPDETEFISAYEFKKGNRKATFEPEEVLHAMYVDPSNVYWGLAPLQVAAKTVDTDIEAVTWNKIALQNRAVTDGVFSFDQPLTGDQWTQARQQVRDQHQGSANARAPWVLGSGAKWHSMSLSPADMDFINGRKMTREEICTVFDVPPPIVGILDKANYSNMREARRVFWLDTIIPLLEGIKNIFNRSLTPYFGENIEVDYDLSNVEALQENFNEKIDGAHKLWTMGIPFNEINQRLELGFDEVQGGDIGFLPANILPAALAASPPATPPPQQNQPNDPPPQETIPPPQDPPETNPPQDPAPKGSGSTPKQSKAFNLESAEQKAAYWKSFEKSRFNWYAIMQQQAEDLFIKEGQAVAAAYIKTGNVNKALAAIDGEEWEEFLLKHYKDIVKEFGARLESSLKSHEPSESKFFNPYDQNILLYLITTAAKKVTYVTDTTKEAIKNLITGLRTDGASIEKIGKEIDREYSDFSKYRSFRIARTEVVAASNFGSYSAALQASDELGEMEKEWIDSADERVRESHNEENGVGGEIVPLTDKFSNGLDYPGDMLNGKAEEVIHCRCTLTYTVKK